VQHLAILPSACKPPRNPRCHGETFTAGSIFERVNHAAHQTATNSNPIHPSHHAAATTGFASVTDKVRKFLMLQGRLDV
jgi:hypothetical protein